MAEAIAPPEELRFLVDDLDLKSQHVDWPARDAELVRLTSFYDHVADQFERALRSVNNATLDILPDAHKRIDTSERASKALEKVLEELEDYNKWVRLPFDQQRKNLHGGRTKTRENQQNTDDFKALLNNNDDKFYTMRRKAMHTLQMVRDAIIDDEERQRAAQAAGRRPSVTDEGQVEKKKYKDVQSLRPQRKLSTSDTTSDMRMWRLTFKKWYKASCFFNADMDIQWGYLRMTVEDKVVEELGLTEEEGEATPITPEKAIELGQDVDESFLNRLDELWLRLRPKTKNRIDFLALERHENESIQEFASRVSEGRKCADIDSLTPANWEAFVLLKGIMKSAKEVAIKIFENADGSSLELIPDDIKRVAHMYESIDNTIKTSTNTEHVNQLRNRGSVFSRLDGGHNRGRGGRSNRGQSRNRNSRSNDGGGGSKNRQWPPKGITKDFDKMSDKERVQTLIKLRLCRGCGLDHKGQSCDAMGKECHTCGGLNHYARVCHNRSGGGSGNGANSNNRRGTKRQHSEDKRADSTEEDEA